jgi:hypothetical protein
MFGLVRNGSEDFKDGFHALSIDAPSDCLGP